MLLILNSIVETLFGLDFPSPAMCPRHLSSAVITHREQGEGEHALGSGFNHTKGWRRYYIIGRGDERDISASPLGRWEGMC